MIQLCSVLLQFGRELDKLTSNYNLAVQTIATNTNILATPVTRRTSTPLIFITVPTVIIFSAVAQICRRTPLPFPTMSPQKGMSVGRDIAALEAQKPVQFLNFNPCQMNRNVLPTRKAIPGDIAEKKKAIEF